jgi:hypothetical protein
MNKEWRTMPSEFINYKLVVYGGFNNEKEFHKSRNLIKLLIKIGRTVNSCIIWVYYKHLGNRYRKKICNFIAGYIDETFSCDNE